MECYCLIRKNDNKYSQKSKDVVTCLYKFIFMYYRTVLVGLVDLPILTFSFSVKILHLLFSTALLLLLLSVTAYLFIC